MAVIFVVVDPQDLCSMNMYDAGVSLSGFACFVTQDLARDLANDVMSLVSSTHECIFLNFCLKISVKKVCQRNLDPL